MKSLNVFEISAVGGGDAAATRTPGDNAWGEQTDGGRSHYGFVTELAAAYEDQALAMAECMQGAAQVGPNWSCLQAAARAHQILQMIDGSNSVK